MFPSNKTIWILWFQGEENAPLLVQTCIESWRKNNPGYQLIILDDQNLKEYIDISESFDLNRKDLDRTKLSNLYRLALLKKYGGVWVDATVFCVEPLDSWLGEYYDQGFFTFRNPGPDRLISTWFMVAEKDNILLTRLHDELFKFFSGNLFLRQNTWIGSSLIYRLTPIFNKKVQHTLFWHTWFAKKVLGVFPYFIFHYTFNKILLRDPSLFQLWMNSKPFEADNPHCLQQLQQPSKDVQQALRDIDNRVSPIYKFDRRRDYSTAFWSTVLQHLATKSGQNKMASVT